MRDTKVTAMRSPVQVEVERPVGFDGAFLAVELGVRAHGDGGGQGSADWVPGTARPASSGAPSAGMTPSMSWTEFAVGKPRVRPRLKPWHTVPRMQ